MKVYAVCPMTCDVACGHAKPDKIFGSLEKAQQYVLDWWEGYYQLAEHYDYSDNDDSVTAAWYYAPNGEYDEESNAVIIEYEVL